MAMTATRSFELRGNFKRQVVGTLAFDTTYPTGGEALTINQLGLTRLDEMHVSPSEGLVFEWDRSAATPKILAYWVDTSVDGAPMAQVTTDTDLAAWSTVPFIAYGV